MSVLGDIAGSIAKGADTGTIGKIAQVIGGITEAGGQIYGGISAEQQSRTVARSVLRRSEYEANLRRREGKRLVGKQTALYAKSGVELSGTPLDVMDEAMREAEMDALMIEMQGKEEAKGYRRTGRGMMTSGLISGGTTLLTRVGGLLKNKAKTPGSTANFGALKRSYSYPWFS